MFLLLIPFRGRSSGPGDKKSSRLGSCANVTSWPRRHDSSDHFRLSIATNTKHMPVNIATSRIWCHSHHRRSNVS